MRPTGAWPTVLAAAVLLLPAGRPGARPAPFVLGQQAIGTTRSIVRLDPRTLRVEAGPRLAIPALSWSFSPDRRQLAVAADGRSELRLVDAAGPKLIGTVDVGGGSVRATAWLSQRRLVALARACGGARGGCNGRDAYAAVEIDPVARRVVAREPLPGVVVAVARAGAALAVLLGPSQGIGPSRLAVFLADRGLVTARLAGVRSGSVERKVPGVRGYPVVARAAVPARAVDPTGSIAAVVPEDLRATTVDLRTMTVARPEPARSTSSAAAPLPEGGVLRASWLAGDRIAIWGRVDRVSVGSDGTLETSERPLGLRLVDLSSGRQRVLVPGATYASAGRAFVCCPAGDRSFSVVDLVRRKVVGVMHGDVPQPLTERGAPFSP